MCNKRNCYHCSAGCYKGCSWCDNYNYNKCSTCCACCWKWRARLIWFPPIIFAMIIIIGIIFFGGYYSRYVWNSNAIETSCTILKNSVIECTICEKYYEEKCNCRQDCTTGSCNTECSMCRIYYAAARITVKYLNKYTMDITVIDDNQKIKKDAMQGVLNERYPVNSTVSCYYQKDNPENFKLFLNELQGWLIATYIVTIIPGSFLLTWIIMEIVRGINKCSISAKNIKKNNKEIEIPNVKKDEENNNNNNNDNKSMGHASVDVTSIEIN